MKCGRKKRWDRSVKGKGKKVSRQAIQKMNKYGKRKDGIRVWTEVEGCMEVSVMDGMGNTQQPPLQ